MLSLISSRFVNSSTCAYSSLKHSPLTTPLVIRRGIFSWFKSKGAPKNDTKPSQASHEHVHGPNCNHDHPPSPSTAAPIHYNRTKSAPKKLGDIKHIVAVASGKGGVGKSTVAANLAIAFSQLKKKVGLLDADIYGPSIPTMMNLKDETPFVTKDGKLIPLENYGVSCMSIGFLTTKEGAVIWRGPMVMSALDQMLNKVEWGNLDVLVIDMPPGTGDAQLTITQRTPLTGAVIVSTPQEVALSDVRRGVNMFKAVDVPWMGIIENMAYFQPECCGKKYFLFGQGGAQKTAAEMKVEFLGEIPIVEAIRENCDAGKPTVAASPESPTAIIYKDLATKILTHLDETGSTAQKPKIVIEE